MASLSKKSIVLNEVYKVTHNSKSKDYPGKVANPTRGRCCPRSRLRIWYSETGTAVPSRVSLLISTLRLNMVLTYGIPPEFHGGGQLFI